MTTFGGSTIPPIFTGAGGVLVEIIGPVSTFGGNITLGPTMQQAGDLLVVAQAARNVPGPPAGWTQINGPRASIYYRTAAGDPFSDTYSNVSNISIAAMAVFRLGFVFAVDSLGGGNTVTTAFPFSAAAPGASLGRPGLLIKVSGKSSPNGFNIWTGLTSGFVDPPVESWVTSGPIYDGGANDDCGLVSGFAFTDPVVGDAAGNHVIVPAATANSDVSTAQAYFYDP